MLQSHGAPLLPSPARLSISSPSPSPSSSNPNPNSLPPNPNPKPSSAPSPAASAALLPLLPPLPRSQSLLLHLSLLASKLFDLSSHRSSFLSSYRGSFPSFPPSSSSSQTFPPNFPTNFPIPNSTQETLTLFNSLQTQLFESVTELQEILDLQDSKTKVSREIKLKDSAFLTFTRKIKEAHNLLDQLTDDYSHYKSTVNSSLDLQETLAYAHKISYTTFAPPEHGAGLPLRGALPPAPQDNEMRASQLYNCADLDLGLPAKKPKLTDNNERAVSAGTESPLLVPTPKRDEFVPVPAQLPITIGGNLPGFLAELPPMPPGWKPGDAINLDAIPGLLDGKRFPGSGNPGFGNPGFGNPAPIQVAHVQLDIDDNSSEYSSDVGSSDDDDED